jgi:hypothetical protein
MTAPRQSDEPREDDEDDPSEAIEADESHDWEAGINAPIWRPDTNTFALPHFAEHAGWLVKRRKEARDDALKLRKLIDTGKWESKREEEYAAGIKAGRDRDSDERILAGLGRQIDHATRLLLATTGSARNESEESMEEDHGGKLGARVVQFPEPIRATPAGTVRERDAAAYLGISERQMRRWRADGSGPAYSSIAGRYWYAIKDLDLFIQSQRIDPLAG